MLLLFLSHFLWAQTTMTSVASGATVELDRFCQCRRVTNSTAQAIMVPHKTLPEFASFYNGPPPNVTVNNFCINSSLTNFNIADLSGAASCPSRTTAVLVSGDSATIRARKTGLTNCTVAIVTTPPQTYRVNNVTTSNTNFGVCKNDYIQLEVSCSTTGSHNGTVIIEDSAGGSIDTVSVSLTASMSCF